MPVLSSLILRNSESGLIPAISTRPLPWWFQRSLHWASSTVDTHTSFDGVANAYTDLLYDEQLSLSSSKNSAIDKRNPHSRLLRYYENDHHTGEKTQLFNPCSFFFFFSPHSRINLGPTLVSWVLGTSACLQKLLGFFLSHPAHCFNLMHHISVQAERKKSLGNFSLFKSPFLTLL